MNPHLSFLLLIILIACLQLSKSPGPSLSTKGFEMEEETRLGSTPPTCHSKCNECHPCFAVQVPSLNRVFNLSPSSKRTTPPYLIYFYDLPGNRYSPYKPLGWKCRCNNHLYNP